MIALVATIAGYLVTRVLGRAFLVLGIGFITIQGMSTLINTIEQEAIGTLSGLPADVLAYMGIMQADIAFSILFSALGVKVSIMVLKKLAGV